MWHINFLEFEELPKAIETRLLYWNLTRFSPNVDALQCAPPGLDELSISLAYDCQLGNYDLAYSENEPLFPSSLNTYFSCRRASLYWDNVSPLLPSDFPLKRPWYGAACGGVKKVESHVYLSNVCAFWFGNSQNDVLIPHLLEENRDRIQGCRAVCSYFFTSDRLSEFPRNVDCGYNVSKRWSKIFSFDGERQETPLEKLYEFVWDCKLDEACAKPTRGGEIDKKYRHFFSWGRNREEWGKMERERTKLVNSLKDLSQLRPNHRSKEKDLAYYLLLASLAPFHNSPIPRYGATLAELQETARYYAKFSVLAEMNT